MELGHQDKSLLLGSVERAIKHHQHKAETLTSAKNCNIHADTASRLIELFWRIQAETPE